jgi:hypothetical protein
VEVYFDSYIYVCSAGLFCYICSFYYLFLYLFSLFMPPWLVCIIHVENRFCNTSRSNLLTEHHHHHDLGEVRSKSIDPEDVIERIFSPSGKQSMSTLHLESYILKAQFLFFAVITIWRILFYCLYAVLIYFFLHHHQAMVFYRKQYRYPKW